MTGSAAAAQQPPSDLPARFQIPYLSADDTKCAQTIADNIEITRNTAKVLIAMQRYGDGVPITSRWLEYVCALRQPEVSIAMGFLLDEKLVSITERKADSKGRPVKVYSLIGDVPLYLHKKLQERKNALEKGAAELRKLFPGV